MEDALTMNLGAHGISRCAGNRGRGWMAAVLALGLLGGGCASGPEAERRGGPVREEADRWARQGARLQGDGDWAGAATAWDRAARQYQLLNDVSQVAVALHNQGVSRRQAGDPAAARESLVAAAELNATAGNRPAWWRNQVALLQVDNDLGGGEASRRVEDLAPRADEISDAVVLGTWEQERARLAAREGRPEDGLAGLDRARGHFTAAGDRAGAAAAWVMKAQLLGNLGDWAGAERLWTAVLGEFEELGHPRGVATALAGVGMARLRSGGDRDQAVGLLRRAEGNFTTLRMEREAGEIRKVLASLPD